MIAHLNGRSPVLRPEMLPLMHAWHFSQHPALPGVTKLTLDVLLLSPPSHTERRRDDGYPI